MMAPWGSRYNLLPVLFFIHELMKYSLMRTQCINHVTTSASKFVQCSATLFVNTFTISFMKYDIDQSGCNGEPLHENGKQKTVQQLLYFLHYFVV